MNVQSLYDQKNSLFSYLTDAELAEVKEIGQEVSKKKHSFIYFPRDAADSVMFLLSGRVKISNYSDDGREIIKEIVYAGDFFGEGFLTGSESRRNYATVMDEETEIIALRNEDLVNLMTRNREFHMAIIKSLADKRREMEKRLEALNFKRSRARILDFIRESILSKCKTQIDGTLVCPFLTHVDIAKMTDTSRQTVTLVLNELKKSQLIDFDRNQLEIHDVSALCG